MSRRSSQGGVDSATASGAGVEALDVAFSYRETILKKLLGDMGQDTSHDILRLASLYRMDLTLGLGDSR